MMGTIIDISSGGTSDRDSCRESRGVGYGRPPEQYRFGTRPDQVEVSRKGGYATALARRLAPERQLEAKVAASKNGAALYSLLRDRRQREAGLEARRIAADRELVELEEWTITVKQELESTLAELERARSEREAQLEAAKDGDHDALVALLRAAGEQAVERAADELGWIEDAEAAP
jgi:hypothetical protein